MNISSIRFKNDELFIIDQTVLPDQLHEIKIESLDQAVDALKKLKVRGAPAIGVFAAYAFFIEALKLKDQNIFTKENLKRSVNILNASRPTAVNLSWALNEMITCFEKFSTLDENSIVFELRQKAVQIHKQDIDLCERIGKNGSKLLKNKRNVLTHCNTGVFATSGKGTALAVIYELHKINSDIHVYVDETRPLGQGIRLTYYELSKNGVNCSLITDSMAAHTIKEKKIDAIVVGADRIALNGDTANKIGTYNLAVLADYHNIPFYVAAPFTTIDFNIKTGREIPIEEREPSELIDLWSFKNKENYNCYNPAFDVTPAHLISAIITDKGNFEKPYGIKLKELKSKEINYV